MPEEDKDWLDRQAKRQGVSTAELVRRAVHRLRVAEERQEPSMDRLLAETGGIWRKGDGLQYQRRLRAEWEEGR